MSNRTTAEMTSIETDQALNQMYTGSARLAWIEQRFLNRLNGYLEETRPTDQKQQEEFDKSVEERANMARS